MNKGYLIFLLFFLHATFTNAQKGWEIGGWLGAAHYFGDLNTDYSLNDPGIAFGAIYRRNFNSRTGVMASLDFGRISAADDDSDNAFEQTRNLSFRSNVVTLNAHFEFNFFNYIHGNNEYYFTPYAFLGFGITKFNPQAQLDDTWHNLKDFSTEGQFVNNQYQTITGNLSFGLGIKWDINRDWSMNAFLTPKRTFTDYLDDVSGVYPNLQDLKASKGDLAVALSDRSGVEGFAEVGSQRGNSENNDIYVFFGVSIMRYFSRLECPKVSKIRN